MIEIGAVIQARVARIEPYGVWLKAEHDDVLVLMPDFSWRRIGNPADSVSVGDTLNVLVLRYNYVDRVIVGSLKALCPEENPYRELSRLEPGTVLHGRVKFTAGDEVTVDLADGARGHISKRAFKRLPVVGEDIDVVISSLLVDEGQMWLEPAIESDRTPACQVKVQVPQLVP